MRQRHRGYIQTEKEKIEQREVDQQRREVEKDEEEMRLRKQSWKRILLMIIAITVHNIPGKERDNCLLPIILIL